MDNSLIEQIRESNNIVDVISAYLPLKRSGANYKGLCPFHEDRNPSMMVSEQKQIFKCFVCGKGGNAFTFVQEYEKISFMEAVRKLAQRVGITVEETLDDKRAESKKTKLLNIYRLANEYFVNNLKEYGDSVYKYLEDRQITREMATKVELGYALDSFNGFLNQVKRNDIPDDIISLSGLFRESSKGRYDSFRNRLMFPIHSHTGQIVAFGGRQLDSNDGGGKYINSPTTELYTKGNELYGLFLTKYDIAKVNYSLVCEGYIDFFRLFSNGFINCVAALGTALTERQLSLLSRYSRNVYFLYDGDEAGRKATISSGLKCIELGLNAKVVILPEGQDPDSIILEQGTEYLQKLIDKPISFLKYVKETQLLATEDADKVKLLLESVAKVSDIIDREMLVKDIGEVFGINESSLKSKISQQKRTNVRPSPKNEFTLSQHQEEKELLQFMILYPEEIKIICEILNSDYFFDDNYKNMFNTLTKNEDSLELVAHSQIIDFFKDESLKNMAAELILLGEPQREILHIIKDVKLRKLKNDLIVVNKRIQSEGFTTELLEIKKNIKHEILRLDTAIVNNLLT
ncbi:MAG: DNA primase [Candidatus Cloacimonadales bacterium]